jgi:integrase
MTESNSTNPARQKPAKPYLNFPLTAHPLGYWCKQIRGKLYYFGKWEDPEGALAKYMAEKGALHNGKTPRVDPDGITVKDVCNAYLNAKQAQLNGGEQSPCTWADIKTTTDLLVAEFGKRRVAGDLGPDDFAALRKTMATRWGLLRLRNMVNRVKSVFRFAFDAGLLDRLPRFGPAFIGPNQKTLRLERARKGPKLFTAGEIRRLLAAATPQLKAMVLLGINCGFGNNDCGVLPLSALDLDTGIVDFPRPKTGIPRRAALWPETVEAIRAALACRPAAKNPEYDKLVFLTRFGAPWAKPLAAKPVGEEMRRLLRKLGINGRHRLGFYVLRHTFRTVADEAKDQPAADLVMGHTSTHMSTVYRESISDGRLRAVAGHVRGWLFQQTKTVQ